jgi:hypothetical protein
LADRKDQPIPVGWAVDKDGKSTTDPKQATGLSPLGGAENTCMCIFYINAIISTLLFVFTLIISILLLVANCSLFHSINPISTYYLLCVLYISSISECAKVRLLN